MTIKLGTPKKRYGKSLQVVLNIVYCPSATKRVSTNWGSVLVGVLILRALLFGSTLRRLILGNSPMRGALGKAFRFETKLAACEA